MIRMSGYAFIPPYLLEKLAAAADGEVAAKASETLVADAAFRRERQQREAVPGAAPAAMPKLPADDGTHPSRAIFDAQAKQTLPGKQVRLEGGPVTRDAATTEAYDGLGATWALWKEVFERDSLDDEGEPLIGTVHYGKGYDNAFWNGTQMVFGDGDGVIFNRFTVAIDVIGHELAHAVTERTAGLVYSGQSGALNEHLSDVFGSLVKQRQLGHSADQADWLIGQGLLARGVKGQAIRSMKAPGTAYDDPRLGKDPQPADMAGYVETADDNGGVHLNSGIPNRAFYLAATAIGGNAWEAAGQIWYDTMLGPIKPDCDFARFAALTIDAAVKRFGDASAQAQAVRGAWQGVGVQPNASSKKKRKKPTPKAEGELTVTKSGGFAGVQEARTVELRDLPDAEQRAWAVALHDRELLDFDGAEAYPDGFCYSITCTSPQVDVQLPEHALPRMLADLIHQLLRR